MYRFAAALPFTSRFNFRDVERRRVRTRTFRAAPRVRRRLRVRDEKPPPDGGRR